MVIFQIPTVLNSYSRTNQLAYMRPQPKIFGKFKVNIISPPPPRRKNNLLKQFVIYTLKDQIIYVFYKSDI